MRSRSVSAPALSRKSFRFPHFGDWTQDGQPLSQGLGPTWRETVSAAPQQGIGLRAAYLLRAEKRTLPLTPVRQRRRVAVANGVPAT